MSIYSVIVSLIQKRCQGRISRAVGLALCSLFLALTGCSDVVTERFMTLEEARSQGAFERGWLPPVMPESATDIVQQNDLDVNTGTGSFSYDLSERHAYIESLSPGSTLQVEGDADLVILSTNRSRWKIRLLRNVGKAEWSMRQL
jgi:hypothetical protein